MSALTMTLEERPAPGNPAAAPGATAPGATAAQGAALIAHLSGDAGIVNTGELEHIVIKLTVRRPKLLVIDISALSFLASLGVGLLVALAQSVRLNGGTVAIAAPTPNVGEALTKMRIHAVIPVFNTVDEALAAS